MIFSNFTEQDIDREYATAACICASCARHINVRNVRRNEEGIKTLAIDPRCKNCFGIGCEEDKCPKSRKYGYKCDFYKRAYPISREDVFK